MGGSRSASLRSAVAHSLAQRPITDVTRGSTRPGWPARISGAMAAKYFFVAAFASQSLEPAPLSRTSTLN